MAKTKAIKRKDVQYEVANGFNIVMGDKKPTKVTIGPASLLEIDDGTYELRYDIGVRVSESELPVHAAVEWLIGRGCLVVAVNVKDESPSEPEPIEVAPEEVTNGEA